MAEENKKSGQKTAQGKSSFIKPDPARSNEDYIKEAEKYYIIPKLVREAFPDLVKLIFETESMDEDEREYWLQIMPIMTEDQIKKFRDILVNEKEQLAKLDKDYQQDVSQMNKKYNAFNEEDITKRRNELHSSEAAAEKVEENEEAALLNQLKNL